MTEQELRTSVYAFAQSCIGLNEYDGSYKKIIDAYNSYQTDVGGPTVTYASPWCAVFVSYVGIALGLTDIIFPTAYCPYMVTLYQNINRWEENDAYVPQTGDIIQYDWDDSGSGDNQGQPDHCGIVGVVNGNTFTVIEGNNGDSVKLMERTIDQKSIRGYCLPDYASMASEGLEWVAYYTNELGKMTEDAMKNNARIIWNYFGALGWSINAVAGMLGNMQYESRLNPGQTEVGFALGDPQAGYGLVQWTPRTKFSDWAGDGWDDPLQCGDLELNRIKFEYETNFQFGKNPFFPSYTYTWETFIYSTDSPATLADVWFVQYERPDVAAWNKTRDARMTYADKWYTYLTNLPPPPPSPKKRKSMPLWMMINPYARFY